MGDYFHYKMKQPTIPFEFVLDHLFAVSPITKRMFGCVAIYIEGRIVLALREREDQPEDNGVWLVTVKKYHKSLQLDFPSLRTIKLFGARVSNWQLLPADCDEFEESVIKVCELVMDGDSRIGKLSI